MEDFAQHLHQLANSRANAGSKLCDLPQLHLLVSGCHRWYAWPIQHICSLRSGFVWRLLPIFAFCTGHQCQHCSILASVVQWLDFPYNSGKWEDCQKTFVGSIWSAACVSVHPKHQPMTLDDCPEKLAGPWLQAPLSSSCCSKSCEHQWIVACF